MREQAGGWGILPTGRLGTLKSKPVFSAWYRITSPTPFLSPHLDEASAGFKDHFKTPDQLQKS